MNHPLFNNRFLSVTLITLISAIIFIPFIGNCPLFDWDEINFAECAREMVVSGDYSHVQLNFKPFWEKPPFFIWLQALSMNVFGVNEFAARFPNAVCSILTMVSFYLIGRRFHSGGFGILWCLLYITSLLPHFYFKTGIIDPWFNLFIFLSLYNCHISFNNPFAKKEKLNALAAGFFLGMAVLTKGPAALVVCALSILAYLFWTKQFRLLRSASFLIFTGSTLFVAGSWFIVEWIKGNGNIIEEFFLYQIRLFETQDSGHGGPFYYHFLVLLMGCFPASLIFILSYFKYRQLTPYQRGYRKVMICLFWVVLIVFSINKTKIVHYSSLCYFPLTFIAAIGIINNFQDLRFTRFTKPLYIFCVSLITLASVIIGCFKFIKDPLLSSGIIKDEFAALNLTAVVNWTGFEFLIGLIFLAGGILIYKGIQRTRINLLYTGLFANLLFIVLTIFIMVPKAELYTQRAAIEFYKECAKHHCYVETHYFKSYAYLFYGNRKPSDYSNPQQKAFIDNQLNEMEKEGFSRITSYAVANQLWMEHGEIDRPAYIVAKKPREHEFDALQGFTKLYERNGFCFFVRMPKTAK